MRPFAFLVPISFVPVLAAPADGTVDCGRLADVPRPAIHFEPSALKTPLRRAHSLLQLFSEGEGRFEPGVAETMESSPLPWRSTPERERNLRHAHRADSEWRAIIEAMSATVARRHGSVNVAIQMVLGQTTGPPIAPPGY